MHKDRFWIIYKREKNIAKQNKIIRILTITKINELLNYGSNY